MTETSIPQAQGYIMIVDDNPANLKLLDEMLTLRGYEVRSFPLGRLALLAAMKNPPELILLDINMPEMDGYEVCERLQSSTELCAVPIIFLSALNETQDKVRAFRSGAVDYISKPFQFEEVHARVETHLKLCALQRALKLQNEQLEKIVAVRTSELADANKRLMILDRSKNDFLNLISHEMRTPLNGILGISEIILDGMCSAGADGQLQAMFEQSRRRILALLDDALLLTDIDVKGEQFRLVPVSIAVVLNRAIEQSIAFARSRQVAFVPPSTKVESALGNEDLLIRALHALLETAIKFSEEGQTIHLNFTPLVDAINLTIDAWGGVIPESVIPQFFDVLSVTESSTPGGDLGLGPAVASRILSLFGGTVSASNRGQSGVRLTVSLLRTMSGGGRIASEAVHCEPLRSV